MTLLNKPPRDRRDAFYMGASSANSQPNAQGAPLAGELLQWATLAAIGFAGVALAFVAGYRANDKPTRVVIKSEKVWRFIERCPEKPPQPDTRRFEPQTIPRTNPGAVELLNAPDYVDKTRHHGRGRQYEEKKGYSRGRPRNSQDGQSVGGVTFR